MQYESQLEKRFLDLLDRSPNVTDYCEQPVWIDYRWFDGRRAYVPDFAVRLADGRSILVEVKPRSMWADAVNLAKWNAATRWCEKRGWGFVVSDVRSHPGVLIGTASTSDRDELELLTAEGPAGWAQVRGHWFDSGRSWTTLLATSLTYGFALQRSPFTVRRARKSPWLDALVRTRGACPT